ncbi:ornithine aminomutase subunit alpha [Tepidibacter mesophilus]|uniref:ornithine aminomutase subunit alpha n=1 Tax=Tepidibacter mesophilus TaxID=655607 RepID=UPI000C08CD12|nr:ornithine aminomutase subunit alpha [Tepidibacter mesophilus]
MKRADDFNERRVHLANLSDQELYDRFWELAGKIVDPLLDLGRKNTTPSVERSVLLRMGFSSLEAKPLVDGAMDRNLMRKGVGHIVYRVAKDKNLSIRDAGLSMIEGKYWDYALEVFGEDKAVASVSES